MSRCRDAFQSSSGRLVDSTSTHVDVLCHRDSRMAQLVSDGPGTETLPVKHGCNRLPIGVRHHPLKRRSAPYPTVITLDIVRITKPANRVWKYCTL